MCRQVVLLADVDVLPSLDLSAELLRPKKRSQMIYKLQEGNALVLPLLDVVAPSAEEGLELAKHLVTGMMNVVFHARGVHLALNEMPCCMLPPDTQAQLVNACMLSQWQQCASLLFLVMML